MSVTDWNTTFFEEVRNSSTDNKNGTILFKLINKYFEDISLRHALDELWKKSYDEGRFYLLDGIIYHQTKHTCIIGLLYRHFNLVLKECHESPFSGDLSEDKRRENGNTCILWPMWQKDIADYFKTCDRCKRAKKSTGKRLGKMLKIQEPSKCCKIFHMDWVTGLPPGGDKSSNSCLVIVDRFSKIQIFLPCHKHDTAMDTVPTICNRVVSWTGIFTNIISERYLKLTSALWTNLYQLFGTNLSFSTAYHPNPDGLAEIMIQTLEDMVRRVCVYSLKFKDCDGFTHYWCILLSKGL
ncbi:hypothetical protein O181_132383 [Austropuccinia psidii MF-1]|uniref:Integrase catalytic domain-containing protein n=1 Tax=Austropuccinia psidii MF-1 TaxID=1389203 RepID=A0A9Q3QBL5_9BASI|nr:hypothetical protein [Austropuccinia psidii MF-1]